MKKILLFLSIICMSPILQGCASGFKERKAPCPPTASLSRNPCNPLPINVAKYTIDNFSKKILG